MKAVVCEKPFAIGVAERPAPVRQAGEALIRVRRVGLCGTDFHIFAGKHPFLSYPRIMGHELSGEVVETDRGSHLAVGQLATINPYLHCGRCSACRKDKPNCCVNVAVLGVHIDGGMAELISVPETAVVTVDGLTADQAAMVEFLSIGAHAVRRGDVQAGERVLVAGAGPIGVATSLFARLRGADVTLIDSNPARLDHARAQVGLAQTALVAESLASELRERTEGEYFDVAFDATGSQKAIEAGFSYVAHGGRYVLVSVIKDAISFSDPEFHKREMTLLASRNATTDDFRHVIDCIRRDLIPTAALHTHSFPLIETPERMPHLMANRDNVLKAITHI